MGFVRFSTAAALLLLARFAFAQTPASAPPPSPPNDAPSIKLGAVLFADYTVTRQPKSNDPDGNSYSPSAFNVGRAYINITGDISRRVAFRITPDVTRDTDTGALSGNLVFRIKYAFAQVNLDDGAGKWKDTWVRLGVQQTPFIDYEENIYRYRFQGQVLVERETANGSPIMSSADTGASFHTSFPEGFGEIHGGLYNGEGYTKAENNDQKAFQIRGTVRPLARGSEAARGFRVTAFYDADHYLHNADRRRVVANATYEHRRFNAGFDYLQARDQTTANASPVDSSGWSVWATPFVNEKGNGWEGLLRVDRFKPNTTLSGQQKQRTIAGLAYWFPHPGGAATAALMLDYERVTFSGFPSTPANATQERIAVHGLVSF